LNDFSLWPRPRVHGGAWCMGKNFGGETDDRTAVGGKSHLTSKEKATKKLSPISQILGQGDQIWRFFAPWAVFYSRRSQIFGPCINLYMHKGYV
jgi:hypothetical protein